MYKIKVSDIEIDVEKKKIKNLHLSVYPPNGRVRIAAPIMMNDESIRVFAISKLPWIKKHQRKYLAQYRQTEREYVSGESHYFQGARYLLQVIEHNKPPKVELHHKKIDLFIKPGSSRNQRKQVINEWYREQLKILADTIINKWEIITDLRIAEFAIKRMKTRWGTCNIRAKRIWLNLELAKKPLNCLEFIILHEMVHLIERKHNNNFKKYMDQYMPRWRSFKDELNRFPLGHEDWEY